MYYFVSPNGTKYKTDKLKQFCEEKEITYHGAKKCLRGIQKQFADGWTVSQDVKEDQTEDKIDIRNIRVLWNKGNLWYSAQDILFALGYTSNLNDGHIASSVIPTLTKGSRVYWNSTSILNFKDKLFITTIVGYKKSNKLNELYSKRIEAIKYFERKYNDFEFFL